MCLQFISLPSARAIVIHSSLTQEWKKEWKWEQMTKGRKWEKKDPAVFFPLACWKWAKSCQEEECRPFPGAERWRGSSVWEKDGGKEEEEEKKKGVHPIWAERLHPRSWSWARPLPVPFPFFPPRKKKKDLIRLQRVVSAKSAQRDCWIHHNSPGKSVNAVIGKY